MKSNRKRQRSSGTPNPRRTADTPDEYLNHLYRHVGHNDTATSTSTPKSASASSSPSPSRFTSSSESDSDTDHDVINLLDEDDDQDTATNNFTSLSNASAETVVTVDDSNDDDSDDDFLLTYVERRIRQRQKQQRLADNASTSSSSRSPSASGGTQAQTNTHTHRATSTKRIPGYRYDDTTGKYYKIDKNPLSQFNASTPSLHSPSRRISQIQDYRGEVYPPLLRHDEFDRLQSLYKLQEHIKVRWKTLERETRSHQHSSMDHRRDMIRLQRTSMMLNYLTDEISNRSWNRVKNTSHRKADFYASYIHGKTIPTSINITARLLRQKHIYPQHSHIHPSSPATSYLPSLLSLNTVQHDNTQQEIVSTDDDSQNHMRIDSESNSDCDTESHTQNYNNERSIPNNENQRYIEDVCEVEESSSSLSGESEQDYSAPIAPFHSRSHSHSHPPALHNDNDDEGVKIIVPSILPQQAAGDQALAYDPHLRNLYVCTSARYLDAEFRLGPTDDRSLLFAYAVGRDANAGSPFMKPLRHLPPLSEHKFVIRSYTQMTSLHPISVHSNSSAQSCMCASDGKTLLVMSVLGGSRYPMTYTPTGGRIVAKVMVMTGATQECLSRELQLHSGSIFCTALDYGANPLECIAVGCTKGLKVADLERQSFRSISKSKSDVLAVDRIVPNMICAGSRDGKICIYDIRTRASKGERTMKLSSAICSVKILGNENTLKAPWNDSHHLNTRMNSNYIVASAMNGCISLFDRRMNRAVLDYEPISNHFSVLKPAFDATQTLMMFGDDEGFVHLYDVPSGTSKLKKINVCGYASSTSINISPSNLAASTPTSSTTPASAATLGGSAISSLSDLRLSPLSIQRVADQATSYNFQKEEYPPFLCSNLTYIDEFNTLLVGHKAGVSAVDIGSYI